MKKIIASIVLLLTIFALASCDIKQKEVTLSFETNGGSEVTTIKAKAGSKITKPADPTLADMTFGGWYADIDLIEEFVFPETMPQKNTTVYAKWNVTITFDSKGAGEVKSVVGTPGSVFNIPAAPQRDGYVFVGWYTDSNYQNKLTYVMPQKNTTAYARWQVFETGSAITLGESWHDNDGVYVIEEVEEGTRFTTTASKGEYAFVATNIVGNAKDNRTLVLKVVGTKDINVIIKLEGGDASAIETTVTLTGEEQEIIWTVEETNLSSVAGQRLLVFVNAGVLGASEVAEYLTIKSVGLYRTVDADAVQKATIYFNSNGGSAVDTYYLEPGTAITAPAEPTKAGYIFGGWYQDKDLTTEYQFTVMPEVSTTVYAKWTSEQEYLADCDLMGDEMRALDPGTYEITNAKDKYTITKLAAAGSYSAIVLPMAGKTLTGYTILRVEIKGSLGDSVLFKINDESAGERKVEFTGEKQYIEFTFDITLDANKSLVLFINPGLEGASAGSVEITNLAYGNYSRYESILAEGWETPDPDAYTISFENGVYSLTKLQLGETSTSHWSFVGFKNPDVKLVKFDQFRLKVQGTAGERVLVKVNDNNTSEKWVTLDGTVQEIVIDLNYEIDVTKWLVLLFVNVEADGSGNPVHVTEAAFYMNTPAVVVEDDDPTPVEDKDVDLMGKEFVSMAEGEYTIENSTDKYVITKNVASAWSAVRLPMEGVEAEGVNLLRAVIKGEVGLKVLFKINDSEEKWVTLEQETIFVELKFNSVIDNTKSLVVFVNAGVDAPGSIEITRLEYSNYVSVLNVPTSTMNFVENDEGTYTISNEENVVIAKNVGSSEWAFAKFDTTELEVTEKMTVLSIALTGPAGSKLLVKVNGSLEKWVDTTGELQVINWQLPAAFNKEAGILVFAEGGLVGTGAQFTISSMTFSIPVPVEATEYNLIGKNFTSVQEGVYTVESTNEALTIAKVGQTGCEWSVVSLIDNDFVFAGYTKLVFTVTGTAGEKIIVKFNDNSASEMWVTLDGTAQSFELKLAQTFDSAKAVVVLFCNPGEMGSSNGVTFTEMYLA